MRIPTRMLCENIISYRASRNKDTSISTLPYWLYLCQTEYARTTGKELCDATFEATTGGIVCPQANRIYIIPVHVNASSRLWQAPISWGSLCTLCWSVYTVNTGGCSLSTS